MYSKLITIINKFELKELVKYTWGILLTPLINDRRVIVKHIESLKSMTDFYSVKNPEDITTRFYDYSQQWFTNNRKTEDKSF